MSKSIKRNGDSRLTKSTGNVFEDLGFDPAEARVMAMRAELLIHIEKQLKSHGWTQAQAAERLGITQPRISKLLSGQWQAFRLDMLLTLAGRLGLRAQLKIAA